MKKTLLILALVTAGVAAADSLTSTTVNVDLNQNLTYTAKTGTSFQTGNNTTADKIQAWLNGTSGWQGASLNGSVTIWDNGVTGPSAVGDYGVSVNFVNKTGNVGAEIGSGFALSGSGIDKTNVTSLTLNYTNKDIAAATNYFVAVVYKTGDTWQMQTTGDLTASSTAQGSLTVSGLDGLTDDNVYIFTKTWGTWGRATMEYSMTASVTAPVPEPATATLSLLALAGLAARRRRK